MDTLVNTKNVINEYRGLDKEESEERSRSCNISATQTFVDRIDFLLENGYVNYSTRSEFLRDIILEKVAKIESANNIRRNCGRAILSKDIDSHSYRASEGIESDQ